MPFDRMGRVDRGLGRQATRPGPGMRGMIAIGAMLAAMAAYAPFGAAAACEAGTEIEIAFGGDTMVPPGTSEREARDMIGDARDDFAGADIGFSNLEGPIEDEAAERHAKKCESRWCHSLRQSRDVGAVLRWAGIAVVSVVNNHALDMGREGLRNTERVLASQGIAAAGDLGPAIVTAKGCRIAFLAFSANAGLPDYRNAEALREAVREARAAADAVVVSMHAGCEGPTALETPDGDERCFGEDRGNVAYSAHKAAKAGAAIVVGHGPHVPRGMEYLDGVPILYSLGNLAVGKGIGVAGPEALAPVARVRIYFGKGGARAQVEGIDSFAEHRGGKTSRDPAGQAAAAIAKGTESAMRASASAESMSYPGRSTRTMSAETATGRGNAR